MSRTCPDCGVYPVKADTGYCRPAKKNEPGIWVIHCIDCHIAAGCIDVGGHGRRGQIPESPERRQIQLTRPQERDLRQVEEVAA